MRENFHAARWDEPLVMELGAPGRRGAIVAAPGDEAGAGLVPESMRRAAPPELPELSEHDVLRHYLHLAQETLGMLGVSLFGTCTVKYNPRVAEQLVARPQVAEVHPYQDPATIQGLLEIVYRLDLILRELSGMDQFVFQPGGGANAAYTHACVTRAYHAARGELETRREVITTIQSHPCNPATAAAAGFDVITLPLEEHGYPSLEALKAAVSERTAALMVGNPDDMGIYNPHIKQWVEVVHDAGALAFYDHANFNGVMGRLRARELGSTPACTCSTRRSARPRRVAAGRPPAPTGAAPSWRRSCRCRWSGSTGSGTRSKSTGRSRSARSASSWGTCRSSCGPTRGRAAWARTASPRRPTCPCSPTTTWRRA